MTTRSKGAHKEYGLKKRLESEGWTVERKLHTRFASGDFFGVADMFAFHTLENRVMLVACTSINHKSKDVRRFSSFITPHVVEKHIYCYTGDRKFPWRHFKVKPDGSSKELDVGEGKKNEI